MTNEFERYSRQIQQRNIGYEGQAKIRDAKILCIGAGGLGSPACLYLASCGIGHLGIVDGDTVALSNLHRQILYREKDISNNKAHAATQALTGINPELKLNAYDQYLDAALAFEIFSEYDLILDCSDNFATRYLINDACAELKKPYIYASVFDFQGQLMLLQPSEGLCLRCLYPEPPNDYIPNCAEAGILGVIPGILGTQQALLALKYFLDLPISHNKLQIFDFMTENYQSIHLSPSKKCLICEKKIPFVDLPKYQWTCENQLQSNALNAEQFKQKIVQSEPLQLIDVRNPSEFTNQHLFAAINIPISNLTEHSFDTKTPIFLYCQMGKRSMQGCALLKKMGYNNVFYLADSLEKVL